MKKIGIVCLGRSGSSRLINIINNNYPEYVSLGECLGSWKRFRTTYNDALIPNEVVETVDKSTTTPSELMFDRLRTHHNFYGATYKYLAFRNNDCERYIKALDLTDTKLLVVHRDLVDIALSFCIVKVFKVTRRKHQHDPFVMDMDIVKWVITKVGKSHARFIKAVDYLKEQLGNNLIEMSYEHVIDNHQVGRILSHHLGREIDVKCSELFASKYGDYESFVINYEEVIKEINKGIKCYSNLDNVVDYTTVNNLIAVGG